MNKSWLGPSFKGAFLGLIGVSMSSVALAESVGESLPANVSPNSQLSLELNGFGNIPIVSGIEYNMGAGFAHFLVGGPAFCFDFDPKPGPALELFVENLSNHVVVDGLSSLASLSYLSGAGKMALETAGRARCFAEDEAGQLVLIGDHLLDASLRGLTDPIFDDRYQSKAEVRVDFDVPGEIAVTPGNGTNVLEYIITVTNNRSSGLNRVAFQELFPANTEYFPAGLQDGTWVCSATGAGSDCGSQVFGEGSIRVKDLSLGPGGSVEFIVSRTVRTTSLVGSTIRLHAGAVAADGPELSPNLNASTVEITVVE